MSHPNDIDAKDLCFLKFTEKFPNLKTQLIKRVIDELNCDNEKIHSSLSFYSYQYSKNRSPGSSGHSPKIYSFASFNSDCVDSDSNSPACTLNQYRNSSELCTISGQTCDLQRLDTAYKEMEKNRDYLTKEKDFLNEICQIRQSSPHYPNINQVEQLERKVSEKYSMLPKAVSYACDLREPKEMNSRYKGFRPPFNPNHKNNNDNNDENNHRRRNSGMPDQLNPNFYYSPKPKNHFLSSLRRSDEKRNSFQFPEDFELPEEFTGHKRSHNRQASDPWVKDYWICPQCSKDNISSICSFCTYNKDYPERF